MQLMAHTLCGKVASATTREYGETNVNIDFRLLSYLLLDGIEFHINSFLGFPLLHLGKLVYNQFF